VNELQAERPVTGVADAEPRRGNPVVWALRQLREPYIQLLVSQLLTGFVALAANVLMVRAMNPTGRGEVALMLQVVYLSTQVLLLGTERSFVAGYHDVTPAAGVRAYGRLLVVPFVVCLIAAAAFAAIAPHRFNPGPLVIGLIACYALVEAAGLAMRAIAVAAGRVRDFLFSRVIESLLLLVLLVALFAGHVSHPGVWIVGYLISGLVPIVGYGVYWLRLPAAATAAATPELNRHVRREGLTLFPAALSNMAMLRVDRLALPALASTAALGLYTSVATMTELLAWPLRAYADSRLGKWRAAHRAGILSTRPIVLATVVYTVVVAPIMAAGMYLLIVPVFGDLYTPAKAVVVPLVAAAGLYAVSRVSLGLLIAKGHGALVSTAEIAGFAVSLIGYIVLIPPYGIVGAAYGSLLGYGACLIFALATTRFVRNRTGLPAMAEPVPSTAAAETERLT
jgi:O-antigen/teichoic acid export membrane protein